MEFIFVLLFFCQLLLLFFLSRAVTRAISAFFMRITKNQHTTIQLLSLLFFPGIALHELAHLFTASLLFVGVGELELVPKLQDGGLKLGSVQIEITDPIRRAFIGCAPIIAGTAVILMGLFFFTQQPNGFDAIQLLKIAVVVYTTFVVSNTMFSSKKDVEGILELLIIITLLAVVVFFVDALLHLGILQRILSLGNQSIIQGVGEFFRKGALFLLVPLGLDVIFYLMIKYIFLRR